MCYDIGQFRNMCTVAVIVAVAVILSACGGNRSGKVVVDVNGNKITEGDLNFLGEINPRIKVQLSSPAGRKRILDNLVDQELLYQEAVKKGFNRDPKVKAKIDLYRKVIIAQSLLEDAINKAAKKYYDEHPDEFKKLKMSHIMIKYIPKERWRKLKRKERKKFHTEEQALKIAKDIKKQLDEGASFSELAMQKSEDFLTKSRGGDLGLISKKDPRMTRRGFAPLLDKAFSMKVGEVAGPIKTSKGYHIITVTRGLEMEPFDSVKRSITFKVRMKTKEELLARLKKQSKIVYAEEEDKKRQKNNKPDKNKKGSTLKKSHQADVKKMPEKQDSGKEMKNTINSKVIKTKSGAFSTTSAAKGKSAR